MDFNIIALLSVVCSSLLFVLSYLYGKPIGTKIDTIDKNIDKICVKIDTMYETANALRSDVERLKDHEKAIWRNIDDIKSDIKDIKEGDRL